MIHKIAIASFVKTIGFSPVKTRLGATLGKALSEEFYAHSLNCIEELLSSVAANESRVTPLWSIAESRALHHARWQKFESCLQGVGPLGERLSQVFQSLYANYEAVIFIGGDSPQLQPQVFQDAIAALESGSDFVIGATTDGGYYLFGARKEVPHATWTEVPYSVANTFSEFYARLDSLGNVHKLKEDFDVDEEKDLLKLKSDLEKNSELSAAKENMLHWLNKHCR